MANEDDDNNDDDDMAEYNEDAENAIANDADANIN